MQRSRRALLRRRALEKAIGGKYRLYSISLSFVFILWGLVFLVSLWTSCGNGHRGVDFESNQMCKVKNMRLNEAIYPIEKDSCPNTGSEAVEIFCPIVEDAPMVPDYNSSHILDNEGDIIRDVKIDKPSVANELIHAVPLSLDEFRAKAYNSKSKTLSHHVSGVEHRLEPGGAEYNYASASRGAKVLAFNKEAKGAFNILGKDEDKYLRNPCSADDKFVVIELSEETLVDVIVTGNFEHHSSNLKEFQLLGSLTYPTDKWIKLGNFTAANVKQLQRFSLSEPKWVRYLKMNLVTHYGSEFYCTLSVVEVYGVDAVERMLEDLIPVQEHDKEQRPVGEVREGDEEHHHYQDKNHACADVPDPVKEVRNQHTSRMPGDTVLKVVMQKVRSLDLDLSVLGRYLEHLSSKQMEVFDESSIKTKEQDLILEQVKSRVQSLLSNQDDVAKEVNDLLLWKASASDQLEILVTDSKLLRSEMHEIRENQAHMDNKGIVVFLISVVFGFGALVRLLVASVGSKYGPSSPRKFCSMSWVFLISCCTLIMIILLL